MLLSILSRFHGRPGRKAAAALLAASGLALALAPNLPLLAPSEALASDLDVLSSGDTQGDGNFLRIGDNKSAVIKLPADVKDAVVGDPSIVDVVVRNKNTAYLFGRKSGQTNVFFFDANGAQIMQLDLEVTTDTKALQKLIDRTLKGSKIKVDTVGGRYVLKGTAANATDAKLALDLAVASMATGTAADIVNAMTIAEGDQVMLKVRVVEVKRDVVKRLGISLKGALSIGNLAIGAASLNPIAAAVATGSASYTGSDFSIDAAIQAMEREGVLRTLAEPTLTAISGQPARFHAGGEFEIGTTCSGSSGSTSGGSGSFTGGSCSPTFKPVGVTLGFTPIVLSEGRISLKIATEVSEIDPAGSTAQSRALSTRSAETTIELPSGGSMMLAGLIKNVSTQTINGTPGLKNLPVLGALFRSRDFTSGQTEMVVIVTPYIVNPVSDRELATPADGFNEPTDRQAILFGRLNKVYGTPGKHENGVYHGTVGYIIE